MTNISHVFVVALKIKLLWDSQELLTVLAPYQVRTMAHMLSSGSCPWYLRALTFCGVFFFSANQMFS